MATATQDLTTLCVNTIRGLSIDGVQKANSGHPGLPLGAAPMAYALWMRHLKFNPKNPHWFNRDRFILSAGHGSMLLYSLLHLTGYDLPLEQLKQFRQLHSLTPGHPESHLTPGVEVATGPLGAGFSMAVGMAIAERYLGTRYNKPGHEIVDHWTYTICSDGDLMEGVASEAASLAGHLRLGKLIALYDSNHITIDGRTDIAFTENVGARFEAYGWSVLRPKDGMDVDEVDRAITKAREDDRPTLIICPTIIGFGSPNKADSSKVHGSPLGPEELLLTKKALGIPEEPTFYIPDEARAEFAKCATRGDEWDRDWQTRFKAYAAKYPTEAAELDAAIRGEWNTPWREAIPSFGPEDKIATRAASGKVINAIAPFAPLLMGGSADLNESNLTDVKDAQSQQFETPGGRNIHFGIREHGMGGALNGITRHGVTKAFGGTFLIFSDYCRPSIRLAALMECPTIFVFTHDSVGLGEDGPTHQPIEQLTSLRAIPNLNVMRPADANETAACWKIALESKETPSVLALTRQALPPLTSDKVLDHPAEKGAYVLREPDSVPQVILVGTGSETQLAVAAADTLAVEGIKARVVNMPSWFLFEQQPAEYRKSVFSPGIPTVSVEAGTTMAWPRYAQASVGIDRFGLSAPGDQAMRELGVTAENVVAAAKRLLQK